MQTQESQSLESGALAVGCPLPAGTAPIRVVLLVTAAPKLLGSISNKVGPYGPLVLPRSHRTRKGVKEGGHRG